MSFTATITINCWKQHKCVGCGGTYRYKFTRKVQGQGNTESDAGAAAEKAAIKKIEREVDEKPCPHCGCVQPDMIGQEKAQSHLGTMVAVAVVAAVLLIMAAIPSATWMPYSLAAVILGVVSAIGLAIHCFVALGNPNANKEKNREKAEKFVDRGDMEAVRKPDEDKAEGDPKAVPPGAMLWLLLATVGLLLVLVPAVMKPVSGWASNSGLKPEVIGPGDTVRLYFDTNIDCVQKRWNGSPRVEGSVGGKTFAIPATASNDSWGMQMSVKSSEKSTRPTIWADITLPKDADLAGQTIQVKAAMEVRYPTMQGGNNFGEGRTPVQLSRELKLSATGAGGTYFMTFWAMIGGSVLLAFAGIMLSVSAGSLKQAAPDTKVTPIRDDDEESADYRRRSDDDEEDRPRRRPSRDDDDEGDWKR